MTGGDRLLPVDVRRTAGCGSSRLAATENGNNVFGSKDVTRVRHACASCVCYESFLAVPSLLICVFFCVLLAH